MFDESTVELRDANPHGPSSSLLVRNQLDIDGLDPSTNRMIPRGNENETFLTLN
jgi:hypothetical protein